MNLEVLVKSSFGGVIFVCSFAGLLTSTYFESVFSKRYLLLSRIVRKNSQERDNGLIDSRRNYRLFVIIRKVSWLF